MAEFKNYRKLSRDIHWGTKDPNISIEQINCGSMLRIADATEVMAQNFIDLQDDRDLYKKWYHEEREINKKLRSSNYHLRGYITRLKKNLSLYKEEHSALIHR